MLELIEWGSGPPVVMVHGSIFDAEMTWVAQRPLADHYGLRLVNRRGYGRSPAADGEDFVADAADVAGVLGDGAHLVGFAYGGLAALIAAAQRPDAVWSLTVVEPPAFSLVADRAEVRAFVEDMRALAAAEPPPEAFFAGFVALVGGDPARFPTPLPAALADGARMLMHGRGAWEAVVPVDELEELRCPKLIVSGAHSPVYEAVCDALEDAIDADRACLPGAGHAVQMLGAPFNQALLNCWTRARVGAAH